MGPQLVNFPSKTNTMQISQRKTDLEKELEVIRNCPKCSKSPKLTQPALRQSPQDSSSPPNQLFVQRGTSGNYLSSISEESCTYRSNSVKSEQSYSSPESSDVDSSPTYCSTCSSSSYSSKTSSSPNISPRKRYLPLSPIFSSLTPSHLTRNVMRDYSPLSPKYDDFSPNYSPKSRKYSFASPPETPYSLSPDYSPITPPKLRNLDCILSSPQSPVYMDSSPDYSAASPDYMRISSLSLDEKRLSPTFIDNSPPTPVCIPSSPRYSPLSPDYSPIFPRYFQSCDSLIDRFRSPTSPVRNCRFVKCPYSPQMTRSFVYPDLPRKRPVSPICYPLSPDYVPSFNGRSILEEDIPCICCSPTY